MDNLKKTSQLVKLMLETYPETRNSDNVLYYKVCATIGKINGIDIEKMSMPHFLLNLKEYGMPAFETVRRTRQKIVREFPELAGNSAVEAQRTLNEEAFREYARGCLL